MPGERGIKSGTSFDEKLNKAPTETLGLLAVHGRYIPAKNDVQYIMQNSDLKYPVNRSRDGALSQETVILTRG